jgi:CRISPR system Cascade subunit CasD
VTKHLVLRLEAPLSSYGAEAIDNFGVVDDFPAASMLTGLFANALGWRRAHDATKHQRLQERLVFAARLDREGQRLTDYQTARLYSTSQGWTTRGRPEGHEWNPISWELDETHRRRTGERRYALTHQRRRDYDADSLCVAALRLDPPGEVPTLDDLAHALDEPARPLFIGRKPCLPASRLFAGWSDGRDAHQALARTPWQGLDHATARERRGESPFRLRAQWPEGEGPYLRGREELRPVTDERGWRGGLHGGSRLVIRGFLLVEAVT